MILKAGDVPNQLHHIALQIQHIAVSLSGSGAVFVNQRKGSAGFVVNEIQDLRRAAAANRFSHDLAVLRDIGIWVVVLPPTVTCLVSRMPSAL